MVESPRARRGCQGRSSPRSDRPPSAPGRSTLSEELQLCLSRTGARLAPVVVFRFDIPLAKDSRFLGVGRAWGGPPAPPQALPLILIAAERAWERLSAPTPFLFIQGYIRRRH